MAQPGAGKDGLKNEGECRRAIKEIDPTFTWTRQTFYAHKEHITHPLVTAQQESRNHPVIIPKTNTGALEAIRDIGLRRAISHPDEVTIDHALKSVSILEARREKRDSVFVILAKAMTGQLPEIVIEGQYTVLPPEEEPVGNQAT
jgi:hypothetical protein